MWPPLRLNRLPVHRRSRVPRYTDRMKFSYERDGVGPRWPWYFDPTAALP
jgi:hypothetical protein